jgi:uncharacterized protein (TIGR03000 family)
MFRRWLICGVPALALLSVLCAATPASAQRWGRGQGYYDGAYGSNYAPGYYGSGYYGSGYYGSGYGGNRWNRSYYSPWGYGSNTYYMPSSYAIDDTGYNNFGYTSFYSDDMTTGNDGIAPDAALVAVRLPADAELWFDQDKTFQTGNLRTFVTPALKSDADNTYQMKALWVQDGKAVEHTRRVHVAPGARVLVDFFARDDQRSALAEQSMNQGYTSFYAGPDANIPENAALLRVRLPENAELWIADQKMQQTGMLREFITPELKDNQRGSYTLHAKWTTTDGQAMDQTRRVQVQPGAQVMVDFFRPAQDQQRPERVRPGVREGDQERAKPAEDSEKGTKDTPAPAPAPKKDDQEKRDKNQDAIP